MSSEGGVTENLAMTETDLQYNCSERKSPEGPFRPDELKNATKFWNSEYTLIP
jgi:hypothetical protein